MEYVVHTLRATVDAKMQGLATHKMAKKKKQKRTKKKKDSNNAPVRPLLIHLPAPPAHWSHRHQTPQVPAAEADAQHELVEHRHVVGVKVAVVDLELSLEPGLPVVRASRLTG